MLFFVAVEYNNPNSIGTFTFPQKLMTGYFQTVTMRTAGFATIDYTTGYPFTFFWFVITMFVGGSPGGTAGGLKTTTFAIIFLTLYNELRGQSNVNIANHTISVQQVRQAFVIFMALLGTLILGTSVLSILNPEVDFIYILFEASLCACDRWSQRKPYAYSGESESSRHYVSDVRRAYRTDYNVGQFSQKHAESP